MFEGGDDFTEMVCILLEAKADPNLKVDGSKWWAGVSPLEAAVSMTDFGGHHEKEDLADIMRLYS